MPRCADVPCADCGKLLWSSATSLPPGERRCQPCRRAASGRQTDRREGDLVPCQACGSTFRRTKVRKLYCSDECIPPRQEIHHLTCAWCAAPFTSRRNYQRFCSRSCSTQRITSSPIPWVLDATCGHWLVGSGRRRRCRQPGCIPATQSTAIHLTTTCGHCGQQFTYLRAGSPRLYCSRECRRSSPAFKQARLRSKAVRRARKRGAITEAFDSIEVFERDQWRCHLCGKKTKRNAKVPDPNAPTLDHVIPLARGGAHTKANTKCAHFLCNARKGDRSLGPEQLSLIG